MSRSPRKHLHRAAAELDAFADVLARFPDTDAAVRAALGADVVAALAGARETIRAAAARLTAAHADGTPPVAGGTADSAEHSP